MRSRKLKTPGAKAMRSGMRNDQGGSRDRLTYLARPPARPEAELDLERLVWDAEYRNAVRHLLKNRG